MRIEGSMQSIPTQGNNTGQDVTALRQQLRVLEQEHSRLSAKGQLSETERKRKEQLEREIERLQQQIQQIEQNQKKRIRHRMKKQQMKSVSENRGFLCRMRCKDRA